MNVPYVFISLTWLNPNSYWRFSYDNNKVLRAFIEDEGECTVSSFLCIFIYVNQTSYLTIKMSKSQR